MHNISRIKGNQAMKFGLLIEYYKRNIFLQKSCRKWGKETSSRRLFVFSKSFVWCESNWSAAWFHYILIALKLAYNKNKFHKTWDRWSRDILNLDFLEKGLGIVPSPHLCMNFQQKCFSCQILLTDQVSLSDCVYFLRYWVIRVLQMFFN